jgi:SAM-dependent methyltransferase
MDATLITAAQTLIDAKRYPPTHDYDLATLTPRPPLDERVSTIVGLCHDFFRGEKFLDVGCSKGFFSLKASKGYRSVLALEPDQSAIDTWGAVVPVNVEVERKTFGQVETSDRFDMVWIGNGHHYLYREDRYWIDRLAKMASRRVVIEGPVGPECRELRDFGAYQTEKQFLDEMEPGFTLIGRCDSPSYTPGRAIWYFKTR